MYTIGKVAEAANVNLQTIRYYERINLLKPQGRNLSGYRVFGDEEIRRIKFIKRCQELGFSLKEIGDLMSIRNSDKRSCRAVETKVSEKISLIKSKIRSLSSIEKELKKIHLRCKKNHLEACPVIEEIEEL